METSSPALSVAIGVLAVLFGLTGFGVYQAFGKTLKGFQSASKEFEREINKAMAEPEMSGDAAKPVEKLPPSD